MRVVKRVSKKCEKDVNSGIREELSGPSRNHRVSKARALVANIAVRELGITGAEVARRLNVGRSSVRRVSTRCTAAGI